MAEHIYSKGTRVWLPDKEQGWISAEVTSATRGPGDTFKLTFVDERGKVRGDNVLKFAAEETDIFLPRTSSLVPPQKTSRTEKKTYLR